MHPQRQPKFYKIRKDTMEEQEIIKQITDLVHMNDEEFTQELDSEQQTELSQDRRDYDATKSNHSINSMFYRQPINPTWGRIRTIFEVTS